MTPEQIHQAATFAMALKKLKAADEANGPLSLDAEEVKGLMWGDPGPPAEEKRRTVNEPRECPVCHAEPGSSCVSLVTGELIGVSHYARVS